MLQISNINLFKEKKKSNRLDFRAKISVKISFVHFCYCYIRSPSTDTVPYL